LERIRLGEIIHLHGMIDDELDRLQWIHFVWVAAKADDAVAHRGEVHHGGHTGEVLKQHAGWSERDLLLRCALDIPPCARFDVGRLHESAVLVAQQVFQQDLH